eukprot:TRINITY_DN3415_c0_g3_i3.p1 TRINITY_DN3415_c0_g3~~TRINITY_DN3415_c0_g3_i3.p1  ORF type:complete len:478 (-),score=67.89 TRINITY_DN3415_c0_g3_i3:6-1439(-)
MANKTQIFGQSHDDISKELRKSHFYMGSAEPGIKESQYQQAFKSYAISTNNKEGSKNGMNLRTANFVLGTEDGNRSRSLYKDSFTPYHKHQQAALDREVVSDLRRHHFKLGYRDIGGQLSEAKTQYGNKMLNSNNYKDTLKDLKHFKEVIGGHSEKWTDEQTYFHTSYGEQFGDASRGGLGREAYEASRREIERHLKELRASNIAFGYDNSRHMVSHNAAEFSQKPIGSTQKHSIDLKKTNFVVGEEPLNYTTTAHEAFVAKKAEPLDEIVEKLGKELRSAHFDLGHDDPNYKSLARDSFVEYGKNAFAQPNRDPALYRGSIPMGDGRTDYESTYKTNMKKFVGDRAPKVRDGVSDRGSLLHLGSDPKDMTTTYRNGFVTKDYSKAPLDAAIKKDLQSSHFQLGIDTPNYVSVTKESHTGVAGNSLQNKLASRSIMKDLRSTHFTLGFTRPDFDTTSGSVYTPVSYTHLTLPTIYSV